MLFYFFYSIIFSLCRNSVYENTHDPSGGGSPTPPHYAHPTHTHSPQPASPARHALDSKKVHFSLTGTLRQEDRVCEARNEEVGCPGQWKLDLTYRACVPPSHQPLSSPGTLALESLIYTCSVYATFAPYTCSWQSATTFHCYALVSLICIYIFDLHSAQCLYMLFNHHLPRQALYLWFSSYTLCFHLISVYSSHLYSQYITLNCLCIHA